METIQTVYLDEAGFTGNNLLNPAQPMFVYSAVAMAKDQAAALHSEMVSRFRLRGHELKGSNLVKRRQGREAISWLLERSGEYALVAVYDKRYALAARFYEYIFEPLLANLSTVLYTIEFHKFVASVLYWHFAVRDSGAERLLRDFEVLMRTLDPQQVDAVVEHTCEVDMTGPLGYLLVIALCQREKIKQEIELLRDMEGSPRWELELSVPSVNYLLAAWGEKRGALEVHCDRSKPIQSDLRSDFSVFNQMIGRRDKFYFPVGQRDSPSLVYNLAGPIQLEDSENSPGIQIADVVASSVAYALNNSHDGLSQEWLELAEEMIAVAVGPDSQHIDLSTKGAAINSVVLRELHERSIKDEDLVDGLGEFIRSVALNYPSFVVEGEGDVCDSSHI